MFLKDRNTVNPFSNYLSTTTASTSAGFFPCNLPRSRGPCRMLLTRFYFDSRSGRCSVFSYGGCKGNANNFHTMADCNRRCTGERYIFTFLYTSIYFLRFWDVLFLASFLLKLKS